jgi:hypothetical protein
MISVLVLLPGLKTSQQMEMSQQIMWTNPRSIQLLKDVAVMWKGCVGEGVEVIGNRHKWCIS